MPVSWASVLCWKIIITKTAQIHDSCCYLEKTLWAMSGNISAIADFLLSTGLIGSSPTEKKETLTQK